MNASWIAVIAVLCCFIRPLHQWMNSFDAWLMFVLLLLIMPKYYASISVDADHLLVSEKYFRRMEMTTDVC